MMTLSDALKVLHLDSGVNDDLVQGLLWAMPDYIEQTTGMSIEQQEYEPLVNTCCNFLLILWYHADHADDMKLQRTIDNLLKCITLKARQVQQGNDSD